LQHRAWQAQMTNRLYSSLDERRGAGQEEREVRIVAIPPSQRLYAEIRRHHTEQPPRPMKPVVKGEGRRRVVLFESLSAKLPIKRVIVGPSRHQQENADRARDLLGSRIPLHCSETPFIG